MYAYTHILICTCRYIWTFEFIYVHDYVYVYTYVFIYLYFGLYRCLHLYQRFMYSVFTKDTLDEKGQARDTKVHVTL